MVEKMVEIELVKRAHNSGSCGKDFWEFVW